MTVAELIAKLQEMPQEATVVTVDNWEVQAIGGVRPMDLSADYIGKPGEIRLHHSVDPSKPAIEIG